MTDIILGASKLIKLSKEKFVKITLFIAIICGLIYISLKSFLLFHSIIEVLCIIMGISITTIALNTYKFNNNRLRIFLGIAYTFIIGLNFIHIFTYKGISVLGDSTYNLTVQMATIGYYMESILFLIVVMFLNKKNGIRITISFYFIFSLVLFLSAVVWGIFPDCYIDGIGQTSFNLISAYIITVIFLISIVSLIKNKKYLDTKINKPILYALILKAISQVISILYIDLYDISNIFFHLFKLLSFYLIYKAIVAIYFEKPYMDLLQREERYRKILGLSPEGILVYREKKLIFANPAAVKLLKFEKKEEIIGTEFGTLFAVHPNQIEKAFQRIKQLKQGKTVVEFIEEKFILEDGSDIDVESGGFSYIHEGKLITIIVFHDIRERKKAEELKKKAEEEERKLRELIEGEKLKTQFFAMISHELRTPLNIILSCIQLLYRINKTNNRTQNKAEHASYSKYLKMMRQNCYRLLRLINNVIDITRLDSGFMKMNFENRNIVRIIEDISLSVAEYIKVNGVNLIFDTEVEEKITACDIDKLERVILNLLSNATKFTEANGTIEVNLYDKEESIVISIKDTGIGIPEDMLQKIFQPFRQVDSSFRRKREGSGIGLSLVKSIVELHGGKITVESEHGKGSEFLIELPIRLVGDEIYPCEEITAERQINVERISIEFSDIYA